MQDLFDGDAQSGPSVELRAVDVPDRGAQEARRLDKEPAIKGELLRILGGLYEKLGNFDQAKKLLDSALSVRSSALARYAKKRPKPWSRWGPCAQSRHITQQLCS